MSEIRTKTDNVAFKVAANFFEDFKSEISGIYENTVRQTNNIRQEKVINLVYDMDINRVEEYTKDMLFKDINNELNNDKFFDVYSAKTKINIADYVYRTAIDHLKIELREYTNYVYFKRDGLDINESILFHNVEDDLIRKYRNVVVEHYKEELEEDLKNNEGSISAVYSNIMSNVNHNDFLNKDYRFEEVKEVFKSNGLDIQEFEIEELIQEATKQYRLDLNDYLENKLIEHDYDYQYQNDCPSY